MTATLHGILKSFCLARINLNTVFGYLVPKNKVFHQQFCRSSANLVEAGYSFTKLIHNTQPERQPEFIQEVKDLETKGDEIAHEIFLQLSTDFITPFDREDIHALASSLDDILDSIHSAANRIELYKVERYSPAMERLTEIIVRQIKEIDIAIRFMESMRNVERIKEALVRINSLENEADAIHEEAIASLFEREANAIRIIKAKEILDDLENATDKCEDVANMIETIVIKLS